MGGRLPAGSDQPPGDREQQDTRRVEGGVDRGEAEDPAGLLGRVVPVQADGFVEETSDRLGVLGVERAVDAIAGSHQDQAVAVGDGLGPLLAVGGVGRLDRGLKAVENQRINLVLRAREIEPAVGVGPVARGEFTQDGRRVVFRIDREADEPYAGASQIVLEALHRRRDDRAGRRTSAEDEGGNPGTVGEAGLEASRCGLSVRRGGTARASGRRSPIRSPAGAEGRERGERSPSRPDTTGRTNRRRSRGRGGTRRSREGSFPGRPGTRAGQDAKRTGEGGNRSDSSSSCSSCWSTVVCIAMSG